ncbi:MAG: hypothetical protein E7667_00120 [Ruminococcaceae bacterium]|nr:hypothetical protein [Oscillospiraceae bacterium]
MKRFLCTALVAVMILSALIAIAVTPAAADDEVISTSTENGGDWKVYSDAGMYRDEDGNLDYSIVPENAIVPGYGYNEDGFFASAEFKAPAGQRFNIMSKEKHNLQEGITMKVRMDDFAYGGDWWLSFSVWDSPVVAQGNASGTFGQGVFGLLRGTVSRTGKISWTQSQSFISDQSYYNTSTPGALQPGSASAPMVSNLIDFGNDLANNPPEQDENGDFILTMEITYDANTNLYGMNICGVPVTQAVVDQYFKYRFADGMAYIGFSVLGSKSDCTTRCTIIEFNGETPTGTDAGEATGTPEPIGEMIDSSTIEDDQPALYFDGANANDDYKKAGKLPSTLNLDYNLNSDNTFSIYPKTTNAVSITILPKNAISYEAADFPYVAVLLRDYCSCVFAPGENECYEEETLSMYYCAGSILGADDEHFYSNESMTASWIGDDGHHYKLFIFYMDDPDFTPDWNGRINSVQLVFNNLILVNDGQNHFDFCYAGFFKDDIAAEDFAAAYVENVAPGCAHENTETIPEVPASCKGIGSTEGIKCLDCEKIIKNPEVIPVQDCTPGAEATCTTAQVCTVCGKVIVAAKGHTEVSVAGKPATCTETGLSDGSTCSVCNEVVKEQTVIDALGHDEIVIPGKAATCTETGLSDGSKCARCNEVVKEQTVTEILPHDWSVAYNYDDEGHWQKCEDCDATTEKVAHDLTSGAVCACGYGCDHAETTWTQTVDPTCSAAGRKVQTCNDCGTTIATEAIEKLPHTPGAEATCTTAQTCTVCEIVIEAAKGHTPGEEATCTTAQVCTVCNAEIAGATGHTPGEAPTCTTAQVCTVCETVLVESYGHKPGAAATCTTAQTCTVCNAELAAATGHTAGIEATCTTAQTCTVCNAELVAALGHTPGEEATCAAAQTCTVCNAELVAALEHTPGAEATCTTAQVCTVCNGEVAPATGHKFENNKCTVCGETKEESNNNNSNNSGNSGNDKPADDGKKEEKKGCGSVVGFSALAILGSITLAGAVCFKKKED